MTIQTDGATKFDSRDACSQWIKDRIVRFKLKMVRAKTPDGQLTFVPQKFDGRIVDTKAEDFKPSGTDEPLENYAEPIKQDGHWLAVMKVQEH